jgi:hypothetical protein
MDDGLYTPLWVCLGVGFPAMIALSILVCWLQRRGYCIPTYHHYHSGP